MAIRTLPAPDPTWGDLLHLAYRQARGHWNSSRDRATGKAQFSYDVIGRRLREVGIEASDQALMRLEELDDLPERMRQRQLAYFALIAYGYDPSDFGLDDGNVTLAGYDIRKIRNHLRAGLAPTKKSSVA